jgi:hypothetical protein
VTTFGTCMPTLSDVRKYCPAINLDQYDVMCSSRSISYFIIRCSDHRSSRHGCTLVTAPYGLIRIATPARLCSPDAQKEWFAAVKCLKPHIAEYCSRILSSRNIIFTCK